MRVNASISEPFVLSTYGTAQQLHKARENKKQRTSLFATHERASGSSDGYATVTAQADGVHILDVSTLHPVISHTLGPSTTFSCPAVTRTVMQEADNICTTYAAIDSSPDISPEEGGRTIWMWRQNLSGRLVDRASQKKKSVVIPHQISALYTCEELPTRLFVQAAKADVFILDADLNIKNTWSPSQDIRSILRTFISARTSCSFVPPQSTPPRAAVLVLVVALEASTCIKVLSVDDADEISELADCSLSLESEKILDISCSNSGHMSFLTRDGTWHSYVLESSDGISVKLTSLAEPFRLTGLSFISKPQNSEAVSLLSTSSSHVLLCALTSSPSPEIVLLLWDLEYSVLLASQELPVPSPLLQSKHVTVKLNLVNATDFQALLVLLPHTLNSERKSQAAPSRSTILVVPFSSPPISTIANAMGRGSSSAKWIHGATSSGYPQPSPPPYSAARKKVLTAMQNAMGKNLPQVADAAFFEWEKRESETVVKSTPYSDIGELHEHCAVLGDAFVKDLLITVLQPSQPANAPYSSEVVRYLLRRQAVTSSMVEGGLLTMLRFRNDWQSIEIALANVLDISEAEVLECLQLVVARHRQNERVEETEAMQVDVVSDLPTLPVFLSSCVSYPTSPPALRSAIRHSLRDAADLLSVVKVLEDWIIEWSKRDLKFLPSNRQVSRNEAGVPVLTRGEDANQDLPPLDKVLDFLQTLLDASFLTLLSYPPSHHVLRNLHAEIEPEITHIDDVEKLRGPLEPFFKAHMKAIKEGGEDNKQKPLGDWRQRRKRAHEQAGLSIGLYQIEELVL